MSTAPIDALRAARMLATALEEAHIDYAIGGAIALGVWSDPRGTLDVDINLFVDATQFERALDALERVGAELDRAAARRAFEAGDSVLGRFAGLRIDLFAPSIPFSWEAGRTRRRVHGTDGALTVLAPEALAVFKLLFFRGKDLVDLERLVAVQGEALDIAYIRRWLVEIMGEDDERTRAWDRIVAGRG